MALSAPCEAEDRLIQSLNDAAVKLAVAVEAARRDPELREARRARQRQGSLDRIAMLDATRPVTA